MRTRCAVVLAALCGCGRAPDAPPPPPAAFAPVALGDRPGLHNVYRVTGRLYSGSSPKGDAGFRSLRELGVAAVVSVDGAPPDLEAARASGLRYFHLPIGYDGVPRDAAARIARVVRDAEGPVYVHCHHGKHRGPAAAAAVARCLDGSCDPRAALAFLAAAGTDPRYAGLYADVERAAPDPAAVDRAAAVPEAAAVPDLTRLMVQIDERWDRLKRAKAGGWGSPDVDAPHEAMQVVELYREATRLPASSAFAADLSAAEAATRDSEAALRSTGGDRATRADEAFRVAAAACTSCHAAHRDQPR